MNWNKLKRRLRKIFRPTITDKWRAHKGDETLRLDYPLDAESLVLDIGGYLGHWTAAIHDRYRCRVEVFEAVPEFAARIEARFAGNPQIRVHAHALGANERTEEIVVSKEGSSVFLEEGPRVPMAIRDAAAWHAAMGSPRVALAKLNIEGGEYELLEHWIEKGLIPFFDHLQIQFHRVAPDSAERRSRIQEALARTHRLDWNYEFVWESWSRDTSSRTSHL